MITLHSVYVTTIRNKTINNMIDIKTKFVSTYSTEKRTVV